MSNYKDRVLEEAIELNDKIAKLCDFMHSDSFVELSGVNQGLLMVQLEFMKGYAETLKRRVDLF